MAAGAKPAIQVRGAKELRRALKGMDADLKDLSAANKAAAAVVARDAIGRAPRLTGKLAGSIKARSTRTRGFVTAGGPMIPYAGPIHFGWPQHNIAPQPFLYDALDARRSEVIDVYEKRIDSIIREVDARTPG